MFFELEIEFNELREYWNTKISRASLNRKKKKKNRNTMWQHDELPIHNKIHTIFTFSECTVAYTRELYRLSLCVTCVASCNHGARFAQFNIPRWTLIFRFGFTETGNRSCRVVHWSNHCRHLIHMSYLGVSYFVPCVYIYRIDAGYERGWSYD